MTASVSAPLIAVRRAVGMAALTAWAGASLRGGTSADDVCDASAAMGLSMVRTPGGEESLIMALGRLRRDGCTTARLVLPVPGDVSGLPGPAPLNLRALQAGSVILFTAGEAAGADPDAAPAAPTEALVLVPAEEGAWPMHQVLISPAVSACWPSLRQARADFTQGVAGHSAALTALDVAGDARGLRRLVLDEDDQPLPALPPSLADGRRELLGRARLVAILAATAGDDDGSAVSAAEATSRAAHLRALASIARRAMAASVSGQ